VPSDGVRDTPDLSLIAANGFWNHALVYCNSATYPCNYSNSTDGEALAAGGTSFVAPMIAGVVALVNQATDSWQGQADYTLYAMAANEYGTPGSANNPNLTNCNSNKGNTVGSNCVFYDIGRTNDATTSGSVAVGITEPCHESAKNTFNCYNGTYALGVSSTSTTSEVNAYSATAGYDFATGIGSANIANLVND
jgi:subtilase family serine protease